MSKKKHSKLPQFSDKTETNNSTTTKPQGHQQDLSQRPQSIIFNHVINRSCLVRGLRDAGFDIDGAQSFASFREPRIDIIFVTRRHGKRVLQAFQGGLAIPGVQERLIAIPKCPATYDEKVDVLGRDANRPVPEVEQIRNSVLEAYGVSHINQASTEPAAVANNQQRGVGLRVKAADDMRGTVTAEADTLSQEHPYIGSKGVSYRVEAGIHAGLSRKYIGKRKHDPEDKTDGEHFDGKEEQGHKRLRQ